MVIFKSGLEDKTMRYLLTTLVLLLFQHSYAQSYNVRGFLTDTSDAPVSYATVAFLAPSDSTLQFYAISDATGFFIAKDVKADTFLVQVGSLEYQTWYRKMSIDKETDLGKIVLRNKAHLLNEVSIVSDALPLLLKGDTVEYNAGAYKTKPDAVVEDLLKKLPGVQVDRAGNLKAQGEQVNKVLVDGKEFFGNDPKVATKNLPADAIKKVQVYNGKSDQSLFTGIDDGQKNKTINLELKDNKKAGHFGSLMGGGGTNDRFQISAKMYRFRKKSQLTLLGMANNINEFGFTMEDYMNFQGGLRGLMGAGGNASVRITSEDNLPINFGQTPRGLIKSGAGGINYTYEPDNDKRFTLSYLGNASGKQLNEQSSSKNFVPGRSFDKEESTNEYTENWTHRLNASGRANLDSSTQVSLNASASLNQSSLDNNSIAASYIEQTAINTLDSRVVENGSGINAGGKLSLTRKWKGKTPVAKLSANASYKGSLTETEWRNILGVTGGSPTSDWQFQDNKTSALVYSAYGSVVRSLGGAFYLEPQLTIGADIDKLKRMQGIKSENDQQIDSLSPDFNRINKYLRPGLSLQHSIKESQLRFALQYESGLVSTHLNSSEITSRSYAYLLPSAMWSKEYGRGKSISVSYNSDVNIAPALDMIPVVNSVNPLQQYLGNSNLRPEYQHQVNLNIIRFDAFNFSSLFINISGRYIYDKLNWSRSVQPDLTQRLMPVNVRDDYMGDARIEYTTPVRKLGIVTTIAFEERYQKGINLVNNTENITTVFNHEVELKLGNKRKDKWDIELGALLNYTDGQYSIQKELNSYFYNIGYFGTISYRPSERLFLQGTADMTSYYSKNFDGVINIPLLKAEASYFFLKNNRACVTLNAFDLLNSNTGLQRISELNYVMEKRSNIIGQYLMLGFKYRLSKAKDQLEGKVMRIGK
jgi:hypothetical protein